MGSEPLITFVSSRLPELWIRTHLRDRPGKGLGKPPVPGRPRLAGEGAMGLEGSVLGLESAGHEALLQVVNQGQQRGWGLARAAPEDARPRPESHLIDAQLHRDGAHPIGRA